MSLKAIHVIATWLHLTARLRQCVSIKQLGEFLFWKREIQRYMEWYEGKITLYGVLPSPTDEMKVRGYDLKGNAIRTFLNVMIDRYPKALLVPRDYFRGKRILDVGCGPIPLAVGFTDCEIYGLDPLTNAYRELGFPIGEYSGRFTHVNGRAEEMPFQDGFFDAVIAVNSIDHVDHFPNAAREISRVLRPGGILRLEVDFHPPRLLEPWSLNDDVILKHLGYLGIKKVYEAGTIAVWANTD